MAVDATLAEWLRAAALYVAADDPAIAAAWGDRAAESETLSPFALKADAEAEGVRQLAFLRTPLALDRHIVDGSARRLLGQPVELFGDDLDYAAGVTCFVVRVEEADGFTMLDVLRRLA